MSYDFSCKLKMQASKHVRTRWSFTMGVFRTLAAAVWLFTVASAGLSQCIDSPETQPDATVPELAGRLVYHAYVNYGDGSSTLYLYDFRSKTLGQLNTPSWDIIDSMNAEFSPDGKYITFMGVQRNQWHIFLWQLGSEAVPVNLTASMNAARSEDPKFSWDGRQIVFKQDGDIKIMDLHHSRTGVTVTAVTNLTKNGDTVENSMPYLSPKGDYVAFTRGSDRSLRIYRMNLLDRQAKLFDRSNVAAYYPIISDPSTCYYVRQSRRGLQVDQIYSKSPTLSHDPVQLPLNDCLSDNSDPSPVSEHFLIFSSRYQSTMYNLFLGDAKNGARWSLYQFGVNSDRTRNKLGANYTNAR